MKFITKLGVTCASVAIMASTMSHAGTVQLNDHYIGAYANQTSTSDYMPTNNDNYNTHWMKVSRDLQAESLTVQVNSNFIGYDSIYKLGDLFLMDGNNYNEAASCIDSQGNVARGCDENSYSAGSNKWEYAFDLGFNLADSTKNSTSNYNTTSGQLRKINTAGDITSSSSAYHQSVNTASQLKGGRSWQIVDVKSSSPTAGTGGSWSTNVASKLLTMTFNISGTSLMETDQIALRWAMSCANDIIEVVAKFGASKPDTSPVPEPSTLLLMLLAGVGLFASKQKKANGFKA